MSVHNLSFGEVLIADDLVPRTLQRQVTELTQGPIWKYGWRSTSGRRDRYCYWNAYFAGGNGDSRVSCAEEFLARSEIQPIIDLWGILQSGPLQGHEPLRVYANAHTYGTEGYVHMDNDDHENYYSTVYYAHPVWHENWSGETVFYNKSRKEIIRSVYPLPGRIVTFHGAIPHAARGPSRECTELRICVVFKSQLIADRVTDRESGGST